jgi:hypothetical protein
MNEPTKPSHNDPQGTHDSHDAIIVVVDGPEDTTRRPRPPHRPLHRPGRPVPPPTANEELPPRDDA